MLRSALRSALLSALRSALRGALRSALRSALRGALRSALRAHRNKTFWHFFPRGKSTFQVPFLEGLPEINKI